MNILDRIFTKAVSVTTVQPIGTQALAAPRAVDTRGLMSASARNELAFACIEIKRKAMQDPRLVVEERTSDGAWQEVPGHPLQRLMMRPLPPSTSSLGMDGATFMGLAVASWDIARVFYAEKVRSAGGAIVGLNPLNPAAMSPWKQGTTQIGYIWRDGARSEHFRYEDLLIRTNPDWSNASPLSVAIGAIDADTAQTDFIRAFFNHGGQPGGILKKKGTITQEVADRTADMYARKYGRQGNGWFRPAVLDDNVEYQKVGSMLNELDSESIRGLTESRVCMAFGVPPLIVYAYVGLLRATYSNLKEAWASFWDAELSPALKAWREFFTWSLLTEFVSEDRIYAGRIRLRWDLSQVAALQDDVDAVHTRATNALRAGGWTLNEYRSATGQAPDEAGDYYLRSKAQVAQAADEELA
jgi:HK97 family phage portal protein